MPDVSETALLELWDRCAGRAPSVRALALLALAEPAEPVDRLVDWPLGRRDRALLGFRERLWGSRMTALASCPACTAQAELDFHTRDLFAPCASGDPFTVEGPHATFHLRPVTTRDLLTPAATRAELVARCRVDVNAETAGALALAVAEMPEEVIEACARALAEADPQADIELHLTCADCGTIWDAPFDPAAFIWHELDTWAQRTLREIARLAAAFGWTEDDVLRLTPRRRQYYLALVRE